MLDVNGKGLSEVWQSEFRGFFFGEGYLGITTNGNVRNGRKRKSYLARAAITVRDDDLAILEDIHSRLGGLLHRERRGRKSKIAGKEYDTKPYVVWRATSKEDISRVCDILEGGVMPSKKRMELVVMRQFLETVGVQKNGPKTDAEESVFQRVTDERERLAGEIRHLHRYNKQFQNQVGMMQ